MAVLQVVDCCVVVDVLAFGTDVAAVLLDDTADAEVTVLVLVEVLYEPGLWLPPNGLIAIQLCNHGINIMLTSVY